MLFPRSFFSSIYLIASCLFIISDILIKFNDAYANQTSLAILQTNIFYQYCSFCGLEFRFNGNLPNCIYDLWIPKFISTSSFF